MTDWLAAYDGEPDAVAPKIGEQAQLFEAPCAITRLRQYQTVATERCLACLEEHGSTMLVMATGLGKTEVICEVIRLWKEGRVLCLAHRDELVAQLRDRIETRTYYRVYVEKGSERAPPWADVVVASVDTIKTKRRLERWDPDHFSLIIVDEVHHYVGNTFERPFEHFRDAKRLGVTATPKRHDKKALGKWFRSWALNYGITEAINDGFLVPIRSYGVLLKQVDLSQVQITAGDYVRGQLDEAMLRGILPIVDAVMKHHPKEQAILFFPGVKSAEAACARFNRIEPGSTCFIDGKTPTLERRHLVAEFKAGRTQRLCNCGIAIEGFDAPPASVIGLARPTRSVPLVTQMIGRGTRVLPGLIDELTEHDQAEERKAIIAASAKPCLHVMDFRGVCSQGMLATPVDVLGGTYSEAERKVVKKRVERGEAGDLLAELKTARDELRKQMATVESTTTTELYNIDLLGICKIKAGSVSYLDSQIDPKSGLPYGHEPATVPQRAALEKFGCTKDDLHGLSKRTANKLLRELSVRSRRGLATIKQVRWLAKEGLCDTSLTKAQASSAITWARDRWNRGMQFDPGQLAAVAVGIRPPEDLRRPSST